MIRGFAEAVSRARRSPVSANTTWALLSEVAQLLLGLAAFGLLARGLGRDEFGLYGATLAIAIFATALAHMGSQQLLTRDLVAGLPFPLLWSRTLSVVVVGTVVTTSLAFLLQPILLPEVGRATLALLLSSQVLLFGIADLGVVAAQAHQQLRVALEIRVVAGSCRLLGVLYFTLTGGGDLDRWAPLGGVSWAVGAVGALAIVRARFGAWPRPTRLRRGVVSDGAPFALSAGVGTVVDSVDRPLLVRFGFVADAGLYTAGFRIASLAAIPIRALVRATDAEFFARGQRDIAAAFSYARKLSVPAAVVGTAIGVALFVGAPVVPLVLGSDYDGSTDVIRSLSLLPLIRGLQIFPANALTGSGRQSVRNVALIVATVVNLGVNLVLIPRYGWQGAVAATLLAELLLTCAIWLALYQMAKSSRSGQ